MKNKDEPEKKVMFLCDGDVKNCRKHSCYRNTDCGKSRPVCFLTSNIENAANFIKKNGRYTEMNSIVDDCWITKEDAANLVAAVDELLRKKRELAQEYNDGY